MLEDARNGILNNTNCDWILFEDGGVLFRYYGTNYDAEYIRKLAAKQKSPEG